MTGDTTPISDEARKKALDELTQLSQAAGLYDDLPPAAVAAAAKALLDEGGGPGNGIHSWRCEHPDRYGPCDCVNEVTRSMLAAAFAVIDRERSR